MSRTKELYQICRNSCAHWLGGRTTLHLLGASLTGPGPACITVIIHMDCSRSGRKSLYTYYTHAVANYIGTGFRDHLSPCVILIHQLVIFGCGSERGTCAEIDAR